MIRQDRATCRSCHEIGKSRVCCLSCQQTFCLECFMAHLNRLRHIAFMAADFGGWASGVCFLNLLDEWQIEHAEYVKKFKESVNRGKEIFDYGKA